MTTQLHERNVKKDLTIEDVLNRFTNKDPILHFISKPFYTGNNLIATDSFQMISVPSYLIDNSNTLNTHTNEYEASKLKKLEDKFITCSKDSPVLSLDIKTVHTVLNTLKKQQLKLVSNNTKTVIIYNSHLHEISFTTISNRGDCEFNLITLPNVSDHRKSFTVQLHTQHLINSLSAHKDTCDSLKSIVTIECDERKLNYFKMIGDHVTTVNLTVK